MSEELVRPPPPPPPPKKYQEFEAPQKIFEILATQNIPPFFTLTLKTLKCI